MTDTPMIAYVCPSCGAWSSRLHDDGRATLQCVVARHQPADAITVEPTGQRIDGNQMGRQLIGAALEQIERTADALDGEADQVVVCYSIRHGYGGVRRAVGCVASPSPAFMLDALLAECGDQLLGQERPSRQDSDD